MDGCGLLDLVNSTWTRMAPEFAACYPHGSVVCHQSTRSVGKILIRRWLNLCNVLTSHGIGSHLS